MLKRLCQSKIMGVINSRVHRSTELSNSPIWQEMMEEFRRAAYLEMRISNSLSPEMQNMFDMAVHKKRAQEAVESVLHEFPVGAEQGQCSICLCDMNSRVARLPCGHCFHKSCVTEWLIEPRSGQRCPLCNQKLKTDLSEPLFTAFV